MPIVVVLFALIALVYGAVQAFHFLSRQFGFGVATGVAVVVVIALLLAIAWWWRRRREVAANVRDGDWTHELKGEWGEVKLAAAKRFMTVRTGDAVGEFIFADLVAAEAVPGAGGWQVALTVRNARQPVWHLPMQSERQARQWARIFALAAAQRLPV
ncbi:hypothetical protein [Paraburkholderia saeva]|uniref:Uncharacterized protein n=1 Tax=Paraburkholderia saeva TaxID=2777537 RepID=A0A9N8RXP5_9BURK|nr:hypothetical protein [Paraburkholderia saeva]CAG4891033.1 hypothetical protein R52603_01084 [Paraburkholderia saeva]CAG4902041.1 hypothetical protein LMG31841_03062 [Paraburkholderia saeva]